MNAEKKSFGAIQETKETISKSSQLVSFDFLKNQIILARKVKVIPPPKTSTADTIPPTIKITYPWDGLNLPYDTLINIRLTAYDNKKIDWVSFSVDGVYQTSTTISPYNFTWRTLVSGVHTLLFVVRDTANNMASASVTVLVNTKVIPPVTTLPSSYQLFVPPVMNQGSEGSCVAFASGYNMRSIEEYYKNPIPYNASTNLFSPEYLYDHVANQGCGGGTSFTACFISMQNEGICTWNVMPYSDQNGCSPIFSLLQNNDAANHKISNYYYIPSSDEVAIKTQIATNHPIGFVTSPDDNFINAYPGYVWNSTRGNTYASHALTIVGYDDVKRVYKVVNQWGTGWGDKGYIPIDYDFFKTIAYGLFTIKL